MCVSRRRLLLHLVEQIAHGTFELRIYPPGQHRATYAAFDLEACSHAGPVYLGVEPLQPGVGTING